MPAHATVATELLGPSHRELERRGPEIARRASETGLAILAKHGLALRSFGDLTQRISHEVALELLDNALHVTGDPTFALHAGARAARGDFGLVDLVSLSAPTLHGSMSIAARYLPLLHDGAQIELLVEGAHAVWTHRLSPGLAAPAASNDYVLAAFFFSARRGLGFDAPPIEVRFMHAAPAYAERYAELFGAPVQFGCERNAIVLPQLALDLPLATRDDAVHAQLARYGDELLQRIPSTQPFAERMRTLIRTRLEGGAPLHELSELLHMSESSVQRRLQAEGTTHSELLDQVRRELATELLADPDVNVSEIAFRLGFAHRPAFHRAFKRWFGVAPSEHRKRRLHSPFYAFYRRATAR